MQVEIITSAEQCRKICEELSKENVIAVDCEGVNLSRFGQLSLIQVATPSGRVVIFDMLSGPFRTSFHHSLCSLTSQTLKGSARPA
jgi:ribonuclease D